MPFLGMCAHFAASLYFPIRNSALEMSRHSVTRHGFMSEVKYPLVLTHSAFTLQEEKNRFYLCNPSGSATPSYSRLSLVHADLLALMEYVSMLLYVCLHTQRSQMNASKAKIPKRIISALTQILLTI